MQDYCSGCGDEEVPLIAVGSGERLCPGCADVWLVEIEECGREFYEAILDALAEIGSDNAQVGENVYFRHDPFTAGTLRASRSSNFGQERL
jgi:hypothetical protein